MQLIIHIDKQLQQQEQVAEHQPEIRTAAQVAAELDLIQAGVPDGRATGAASRGCSASVWATRLPTTTDSCANGQ